MEVPSKKVRLKGPGPPAPPRAFRGSQRSLQGPHRPSKKALSRTSAPRKKGSTRALGAVGGTLTGLQGVFRGPERNLQGSRGPLIGLFKGPPLFEGASCHRKKTFSKTRTLGKGGSKRPLALSLLQGEVCRNFGILRVVSLVFGGFK